MRCNTTVWISFGTAGNTLFAPGTRHNVCEFMFVQYSIVGPSGGFRALATGVYSLCCTVGSCRCWNSLSLLLNRGLTSNPFNLFNWLFMSQRHHSLHLIRISSRKIHPEGSILTFQFDTQLVSMVSRRKPKSPVEKIPLSFLRRSLRTQPQLALRHQ